MTEDKPSHTRRNLFIAIGVIAVGMCLCCGLLGIVGIFSGEEISESLEEISGELEITLSPVHTALPNNTPTYTQQIEKTVIVIHTQVVTATEPETTSTITSTPTITPTPTNSPTSTRTPTPSRTPTITRTPTSTLTNTPEPTEDMLTRDHWDGIYGVGIDIAPGQWQVNDPYIIPLSGQPDCYWARYNIIFNIIVDSYGGDPPFIIIVQPSDSWVELDHCGRVIYLGP